MKTETVAISTLTPDPRNVRRHPKRNLDAIGASLQRFGQQKPIVVNAAGSVIAGNGTLAAARRSLRPNNSAVAALQWSCRRPLST